MNLVRILGIGLVLHVLMANQVMHSKTMNYTVVSIGKGNQEHGPGISLQIFRLHGQGHTH